jgi:hypothetical protein
MEQGASIQYSRQSSSKTWKTRAKNTFIRRSWWMFLFLALCYLLYSQGMHKKKQVLAEIRQRLQGLEAEKQFAVQEHEDLLLRINSQSDPAWIQMTLMKGLGLVPEGQLKVYFYKDDK